MAMLYKCYRFANGKSIPFNYTFTYNYTFQQDSVDRVNLDVYSAY